MRNYIMPVLFTAGCCACKDKPQHVGQTGAQMVAIADTVPFERKPVMDFGADTVFDFGPLKEGQIEVHDFNFTNTGQSPLMIQKATGSCGCTMPDYPQEPVPPGGHGIIRVTFNSANKMGKQLKSVVIYSNARHPAVRLLIKSDIAMN